MGSPRSSVVRRSNHSAGNPGTRTPAKEARAKESSKWHEQILANGRLIVAGLQAFVLAVFSRNVHSYFLWSSGLYAAAGGALMLGRPQVNAFLCNRVTQESLGGPGCASCRSDLLMCPKNLCFRSAVNITWHLQASNAKGSLYQAFMEASTDLECNAILRTQASSPVQMVQAIYEGELDGETVSNGCKQFHCGVLKNALGEISDLGSVDGVCTNHHGTKGDHQGSECVCQDLVKNAEGAHEAITDVCGNFLHVKCPWGDFLPAWCGGVTPTPGPGSANNVNSSSGNGTEDGGAAFRRLRRPERLRLPPPGLPALPEPPALPGLHALRGLPALLRNHSTAELDDGCGGAESHSCLRAPRALQSQQDPVSADINSQLEDWEVGEWSKCICYQQCIPGVHTRLVKCFAWRCKDPKPAIQQVCHCRHCAECTVVRRMYILSWMFFAQSWLAFIVFLCYLHATTWKEERLIKISIFGKIMGVFCKYLPSCVRLMTLANLSFVGLILVQAFVPTRISPSWMRDCSESRALRLTSLMVAGIWSFQLAFGCCARRATRKPPWLFVPDRTNWPTPFRQIRDIFRSLGP